MISNNTQIPKKEGQEYPPIPENVYQVELLDITEEMKPKYQKPNETELMLSFQFTILAGKDKDGSSLRGRNMWRNYVQPVLYISSKGKNTLYQIIEAIIGHEMTPEEEATMSGFFLNSLIGKQCRVVTKNTTKDEKTYSNIANFLPSEIDYNSLTAEEKEVARVKKVEEKTKPISHAQMMEEARAKAINEPGDPEIGRHVEEAPTPEEFKDIPF